MGIAQLVHTISNFNISKAYIQTYNSAIFKFIWRKKKDKIEGRVMISDYDKDVLRAPSIHTMAKSLKLAWIPRLSKEENYEDSWNTIPNFQLPTRQIWRTNLFVKVYYKLLNKTFKLTIQLFKDVFRHDSCHHQFYVLFRFPLF